MKKILKVLGLIVILFIIATAALGHGSGSSGETKAITQEKSDSKSSDSKDSGATDSKEETKAAEKEEKAASLSIEEQVLVDKDGLKITAKEWVEDSLWGDGIKLLIENDSDKNLGVGCNALIVNNYMVSDLFSETVAAGKKSNKTLNIFSSSLKNTGIKEVGQIEIYFHVYDGDSYATLFDCEPVTIKTSAFDNMEIVKNDDGQELYNQDGIRIVGKFVDENSFWGTAILLFIENNTERNICVQCDDMSINGFMVTPFFSSTVYAGRMALDDITIMNSDLEENDIETVEDIELKFHIFDNDSFSTIKDTDTIAFSAK